MANAHTSATTFHKSAKDLSGQRFGRLVVLHATERRQDKNIIWQCQCDCGRTSAIAGGSLTKGHTRSCGCLKDRVNIKHGASSGYTTTITYRSWLAMRSRCNNPKNKYYHLYGGRGIQVCERWNNYELFLADVGPRPSNSYSLERSDRDGHYEPSNVSWATSTQQSRNTNRTRLITIGERTLCLTDWMRETGLSRTAVYLRIKKGWTIERVLLTPSQKRRRA